MSKRIVIVEDEKNIVDILTFNLNREGYETLEAYDGAAGLQLALEQNPDLILLDLMLPKMNGFDVCRNLRKENRSTPVIMLTAREEETDKVLGLELGADDYITKPFSMRELLARVKANIRRSGMVPAGKAAAPAAGRSGRGLADGGSGPGGCFGRGRFCCGRPALNVCRHGIARHGHGIGASPARTRRHGQRCAILRRCQHGLERSGRCLERRAGRLHHRPAPQAG